MSRIPTRWSLMALSGQSLRRNSLSAIGSRADNADAAKERRLITGLRPRCCSSPAVAATTSAPTLAPRSLAPPRRPAADEAAAGRQASAPQASRMITESPGPARHGRTPGRAGKCLRDHPAGREAGPGRPVRWPRLALMFPANQSPDILGVELSRPPMHQPIAAHDARKHARERRAHDRRVVLGARLSPPRRRRRRAARRRHARAVAGPRMSVRPAADLGADARPNWNERAPPTLFGARAG